MPSKNEPKAEDCEHQLSKNVYRGFLFSTFLEDSFSEVAPINSSSESDTSVGATLTEPEQATASLERSYSEKSNKMLQKFNLRKIAPIRTSRIEQIVASICLIKKIRIVI